MNAYNSATVVDRVVLLILEDSKKISEPLVFFCFAFLCSPIKITIARLRGFVTVVPECGIWHSKLTVDYLPVAKNVTHRVSHDCLHSLFRALQSPIVGPADADADLENW